MRWLRGGRIGVVVFAVVLAVVTGSCSLMFGVTDEDRTRWDAEREADERAELETLRNRLNVLEQRRNEAAPPTTSGGSSDVPSPTTTLGGPPVVGTYEGPPSGVTCSDIEPYALYTFVLWDGTVTIEAGGQTQATGAVASDGSFTIEAADVGITVAGRAGGSSLTAEFSAVIDGCAFTVIADRVD